MTDQITRSITIDAPVERVWRAISNAEDFGTWFRVKLTGDFVTGQVTRGTMTLNGCEGLPFWVRVEVMEEPQKFSFSWPCDESVEPNDPDLDTKTTLVEFLLEPFNQGARLTIKESGFEKLPLDKRLQVFRDNEGGWKFQSNNIAAYLT